MARRDPATLDLFRDYTPKEIVPRFEEARVQAETLEGRLARSVAAALHDCPMGRPQVAQVMSAFLREDVSVSMLDAWASQAKEGHRIPATRLVALCVATGDERPLQALLGQVQVIAVPQRYEALMRREMALEAKRALEREIESADAEWRASK